MKSQEYIINELESFIKKFTNVRVRYEYDEGAKVHIVEVLPNDVYRLDEEYILWERQMFHRFVEVYNTENICFISDDALVGIENAELVLCGSDYLSDYISRDVSCFNPASVIFKMSYVKECANFNFGVKIDSFINNEQFVCDYLNTTNLLAA